MPIILAEPAPAGVALESWLLGGDLELNDGEILRVEAITDPPAAKKPEWVSGTDSDGALLGRIPKYENAVVELRMRVMPQANQDAGLAHIGGIIDRLQEAEQNADGIALVWQIAGSTLGPLTARVLLGEIVDLPKDWNGENAGWWMSSPVITIRLTRSPFYLGEEYEAATVTSAAPLVSLEIANVPGDVPALGRLVVTDAATQARRFVAWGMESRWYSATTSLIVDSLSMVTTGYAGVTATQSGAYSGASNNVISATLRPQAQAVCGLGNLAHIGTFRPQLRFYASATTIALRLTYQTGDGPLRSLSHKIPVIVGWNHVDLGQITIPATVLGTQKWTGRIEAYSTATGGETFAVDAVWLMPAERFGRARATFAHRSGSVVAYDDFAGTTAGAALNGRVAPLGGTWATSGTVATEFVFADGPDTGGEVVAVTAGSATAGRRALLGSTTYDDVDVLVRTRRATTDGSVTLLARYVDSSNSVSAILSPESVAVQVDTALAGGVLVAYAPFTAAANTWYAVRLVVYASGQGAAQLLDANGSALITLPFYHADLATGGTLATGKVGFVDGTSSATVTTRYYDALYVAEPPAETMVCHPGQSIEFRHDAVLREDSTGTYSGPPPEYVGGRVYVPNAGGPDRKTRAAVIARRSDIESSADNELVGNATMDSTTVTAFVTPQFLAIPRS